MGNPKQKWTSEEEEALRAGVAKYGPGKWKFIQKDPDFNQFLHSRSNIDLKDKWRNMSAAGQGSRDKLRTPKAKSSLDAAATPSVNVQTPAPVPTVAHESPADPVKDEPAKDLSDSKTGPRYNDLIYEALAAAKDSNGLDLGSIYAYIEQRTEAPLPPNFRKHLGAKLRRLITQAKLEKVDSYYKMKSDSPAETTPNARKDNWPRQQFTTAQQLSTAQVEEAAKTAAYKVAEAENTSFLAAEAVDEAERVSRMLEDTNLILQLAKDLHIRCSQGDIPMVA